MVKSLPDFENEEAVMFKTFAIDNVQVTFSPIFSICDNRFEE